MDRSLAALEEGKSSENLQNTETGRGAIASGDFEKRAHDDRETESDFDSLDEDAKSGESSSGLEAEENDSSDSDIELQGPAVIRPKKPGNCRRRAVFAALVARHAVMVVF